MASAWSHGKFWKGFKSRALSESVMGYFEGLPGS